MPTMVTAVDGNAADPSTGNAKSGSPYKSYVALFRQVGTDNPIVTIFNENDSNFLGNIVWERVRTGLYSGTLTGEFTQDKTFIVGFGSFDSSNGYFVRPVMNIYANILISGYVTMYPSGVDQVRLEVFGGADPFPAVEFGDLTGPEPSVGMNIEIRVYQNQ